MLKVLQSLGGLWAAMAARANVAVVLRDREARLSGMINSALDAIVTMDAEGKVTDWNHYAESLFGFSRDEVIGRMLSTTIVPERFREAHERGVRRFLATGEGNVVNRRIEISALHRDGHEFPVELTVSPMRIGDATSFTAFVRDISERKQAEAVTSARAQISDASNSARDLQALFPAIHEIVRGLMPAGGFYIAVKDPASGEVDYPYFVREQGEAWSHRDELTDRVLTSGRPARVHEDGAAIGHGELGDWLAVPLRTQGRTVGVLAVHSRVQGACSAETREEILEIVSDYVAAAIERKRAQETLAAREARFRALIEQSADAITLLDPDGGVRYASPATARMLGAEVGGFANLFDIVHPDDRAHLTEALERARGSAEPVACHPRVRHSDGSWRSLESLFTNQLDNPHVRAIVNNFRDVTERRRLEEQYQQMETLHAVGRLAGGIAHDFNNLLTAILGCTELLHDALDPASRAHADVAIIRDAAQRGADLTRQLLAYSRKQALQPVVFDVNQVLKALQPLLERLAGERNKVHVVFSSDRVSVRADPGQFEQVAVNLVMNARDAMPHGGKVTIETACVDLPESRVQGHIIVPGGRYVVMSVRDTGVGMNQEMKAHLFEPFYTTKPPGKGTGLGLATVYGIVKQSGGFVVVESAPGRGSEFRVYLKRSNEALTELDAPVTAVQTPRHGDETILLVEDEPAVREVSRRGLQARGYRVIAAGSGSEALSLVADADSSLRLLVSDVVMPDMQGTELARRLRKRFPNLAVLLMSGFSHEHSVDDCSRDDIAFVQKPFTFEYLESRVRELLDR